MNLVYSWAKRNDSPQIKKFIVDTFGSNSIQAAPGRFEALFLDHPQGFYVALCIANDKIVGIRCYLPVSICCNQKIYFAAFPIDLMVKSEYRREGISHHFLDMAQEKFQFTVSSGQSQLQSMVYTKNEASIVSSYNKGYLIKKPLIQSSIKATARDYLAWMKWCSKRKVKASISKITAVDNKQIKELLTDNKLAEDETGSVNDLKMFNWRYYGSFYKDCTVAQINFEKQQGIVVYKIDANEITIVDIYCHASTIGLLIKAAVNVLPSNRITVKFAGSRLENTFIEAGFLVRPNAAKLTVYSKNKILQKKLSNSKWMIFSGDSDTALLEFP